MLDKTLKHLSQIDSQMCKQPDASLVPVVLIEHAILSVFPVLEVYGEKLVHIEAKILEELNPSIMQDVHALKRQLVALRRAVWPTREAVMGLQSSDVSAAAKKKLKTPYGAVNQVRKEKKKKKKNEEAERKRIRRKRRKKKERRRRKERRERRGR